MTVSSETNRSGPFNGNGVTTAFDYEFRITNEAYVRVIKNVDGAETTLTLGADYTVTGVGDDGGGQVICTVAPATGETITNILSIPFTQELDLENQGAYNAQDVEDALDLAAQRDLQLSERLARAIVIPASADPSELDMLIENVIRLTDSVDAVVTVAGIAADVSSVADVSGVIPLVPGLTADAVAAASAAATSAMNAATSETNAAGSATLAQKWAANPEDVEVSGGLFSAFHWYRKTKAVADGILNTLAGWIHAATAKTPMVDADEFGFWDSVSGGLRKLTLANLVSSIFTATRKITGANFVDDLVFWASGALTKGMKFDLSAITAGLTRLVRIPDMDTSTTIWEPIYKQTLSGVTTAVVNNLSAYDKVRFTLEVNPDSVATTLTLQLSTDNGSTFLQGGTDYGYQLDYGAGTTGATSGGSNSSFPLSLAGNVSAATSGIGLFADVMIAAFNKARYARIKTETALQHATLGGTSGNSAGTCQSNVARNAFRILCAQAFSGTLIVEGVRG